ncbi:MAG: hypothetical protein K8R58_14065 [Bacteroidales bacterium]|nr:hypothetical protein [Bacteroidales bacterium]
MIKDIDIKDYIDSENKGARNDIEYLMKFLESTEENIIENYIDEDIQEVYATLQFMAILVQNMLDKFEKENKMVIGVKV